MHTNETAAIARPTAIGGPVLGVLGYLGGWGILVASAMVAPFRRRGGAPPLRAAIVRHCDVILGMGLPLVGLMHVGMASFLTMQAFYGATFVDAAGPVVVLGLVRNISPLLVGFALTGVFVATLMPELAGPRAGLDSDPDWVPDREVVRGEAPDPRPDPGPARLAAARLGAAALAGPVLVVWGIVVGVAVGCLVSRAMLKIPFSTFFGMTWPMLWVRDVWGVAVKGVAYAVIPASLACLEGLTLAPEADASARRGAGLRAACLSIVLILMFNNAWFLLVYHAGSPFGPTVVMPPGR